ncbi:LacI family DNA-binding transcriptional regulator [Pseudoroseicyclus aestuarii]|uniref:LacI family transcriptional regulator n=1 Tax=Pseudoroseicyclus aestuarii TaxID=1795041 RepID=A0A318SR06_9RHOB|nr:LacI family DNA-binding transcriptional regulator [Pseudoroseicyclus aestuarii]PYE84240.1 LacI family transcriptional regulator [Pseudoroseicyclus aestuarii]
MPDRPTHRPHASRRVRLEDLARDCGVSIATVSRALSGEGGVRPDLRDRVQEAAQRLGYAQPALLAGRRVILAATQPAVVDYGRNQFTLGVLEGVKARAAALRMEVAMRRIASPADEAAAVAEAASDPQVAGLLLLTPGDDEAAARLRGAQVPAVLINGDDPYLRLGSVAPANRAAAALATDLLLSYGHRRILLLTRPGRRTITRREEGYADRMAEAGLPAALQEVPDWVPDLAAEALRHRIETRGRDFTAVLCTGDSLAVGALMALADLGIAVPHEVSVMGFDGYPQAALQSPPLSALEIPMQQIGATALDLLAEAVARPASPARRVEIACGIVERGSTGPAPL